MTTNGRRHPTLTLLLAAATALAALGLFSGPATAATAPNPCSEASPPVAAM